MRQRVGLADVEGVTVEERHNDGLPDDDVETDGVRDGEPDPEEDADSEKILFVADTVEVRHREGLPELETETEGH